MADLPPDAELKSILDYINTRSSRKYHYHSDDGEHYCFYVQWNGRDDIGKPLLENLTREALKDALILIQKYREAEGKDSAPMPSFWRTLQRRTPE